MTQALPPIDYLVIGHVTHDLLDGGYTVGGTATYAALTAMALGARVGVVTSAGADFDVALLTGCGLAVVQQPASATTTFENHYLNGFRRQLLHARAETLTPPLIPAVWETTPLVHLGPVAWECDPALLAHFAGRAFVGLTPQGWMRQVDAAGQVAARPWAEAEVLLPLASAVVLSIDDVQGDWELIRYWAGQTALLVATTGREGGVLFCDGQPTAFPAVLVPEVDPTGAGDIFAATFFYALASGRPPYEAACTAACIASHSVQRVGLAGAPLVEELARCFNPGIAAAAKAGC